MTYIKKVFYSAAISTHTHQLKQKFHKDSTILYVMHSTILSYSISIVFHLKVPMITLKLILTSINRSHFVSDGHLFSSQKVLVELS